MSDKIKCETPEDLKKISLFVSLDVARTMLVMADMMRMKIEDSLTIEVLKPGTLGPQQKLTMQRYLIDFYEFTTLISKTILERISVEDQKAIQSTETARSLVLEKELMRMRKTLQKKEDSLDPNYFDQRHSFSKTITKHDLEEEFGITLPDDCNVVPGDDDGEVN